MASLALIRRHQIGVHALRIQIDRAPSDSTHGAHEITARLAIAVGLPAAVERAIGLATDLADADGR